MIGGMFILFLVLLLLNVPIAFSLGASSLFYLLTSNMNAAVLAQKFYAGIDSFTLLCIPGFMLAGALMNGGGITRRILNFVIGAAPQRRIQRVRSTRPRHRACVRQRQPA